MSIELYRLEEHFLWEITVLFLTEVQTSLTRRFAFGWGKINFLEKVCVWIENNKIFIIDFIHQIFIITISIIK